MKTIWKFELETTDQQTLKMPNGAEILTVQIQHGVPCLWAMIYSDEPLEDRIIEINGTGNPVRDPCQMRKYIGTYQLQGGAFIGHVFERLSK